MLPEWEIEMARKFTEEERRHYAEVEAKKARAVHGAEGPGQDARHDMSEVEFVGETVMTKTSKPKNTTF